METTSAQKAWDCPQITRGKLKPYVLHSHELESARRITPVAISFGQSGLGDREGQRLAVASAVATEVSRKVGRRVHDNLGSTGRGDLGRGNHGLQLSRTYDGSPQ